MSDGEIKYKVVIDDDGVVGQLNTLDRTVQRGSSGIGRAFLGVAAAVGTAAVAMGGAALKVGMDFEQQMSRVQAISGATEEELQRLNDQAIELGATTAFSATEAAAGMENLASAGFTVNAIYGAMPGLLDLAAVSGGDVAAAAAIAASAINGWNLEASEAGHVADVLARAAADTNAEAMDMGAAFEHVAPVANLMGLSLEETAAAIGIMSNAGIMGSRAGTSLSAALSRLSRPTDVMLGKMEELGIDFYDAAGNMLPMQDQIAMLQGAFEGLTQEERNNALVTIYGQESLAGMLTLIEAGPAEFGALTESLQNSDGAAAEMAATIQDNLAGSIEGIKGQLETLGISIYQGMEEPLKGAAQVFSDFLTQISENGTLETLTKTLGKLGKMLVESLVDVLPIILDLINSLLSPLLDIASAILPELLEPIKEMLPLLLKALDEILEPLLSLIDKILPILMDAAEEIFPVLIKVFEELLPPIMELVEELLPPLLDVFMLLIEPLLELVEMLLPSLSELIKGLSPLFDTVIPVIKTLANVVSAVLGAALEALKPIIDSVMKIFSGLVDFISGVFTGDWEKAWKGIVNLFKGIFNLLPAMAEGVINGAISIINKLIDGVNGITGELGIPAIPHIPNVSIPRFHAGGIIDFEGGAYEGEIIARRGEMVLTEAQQAEVWKVLDGGADLASAPPPNISVQNNITGTVEMDGRVVGQIIWENLDDVTAFQ